MLQIEVAKYRTLTYQVRITLVAVHNKVNISITAINIIRIS